MDLNNYSPYPKNPKIAGFFKEIGLADELGSGIKKIVKYTKIYSGGIPEFREDEVFSAKIPLVKTDDIGNEDISSQKLKELILNFIKGSSGKTRKEINDYIYPILNQDIKIMDSRVRTALTYLRKKNLIENGGSDTKSTWLEK